MPTKQRQFCNKYTDSGFLTWIHCRLRFVHDEDPLYDYMHRLREIIDDLKQQEQTNE